MPTPEFILTLREKIGHDPLFLTGITAVVVRGEGRSRELLLVRRADNGEWTPVCGIVEPGQQVDEVAAREVTEETTITCEVDRLVWVCTHPEQTYTNGDVTSYVNFTFLAHATGGVPRPGDDESTEAGWFTLDELPPMRQVFLDRIHVALADEPGVLFGDLPGSRH